MHVPKGSGAGVKLGSEDSARAVQAVELDSWSTAAERTRSCTYSHT